MTNNVLLLMKPGFVHLTGRIVLDVIDLFGDDALQLNLKAPRVLTTVEVQAIWGHAQPIMGERWYGMVAYLTSAPVRPILITSTAMDLAHGIRDLVGATDPRKARKDTWRGRHHNVPADATDYYRNVLHAATDPSEVACNLRALGL